MPKIDINGNQLYYELHGQGKPLVLIAGYSCDISLWSAILDDLKEHFQILMFDNRGVGRSASPDKPLTIEDMANDTMELVQKLGLKNPHILGHSMGGCILQTIAKNHREFMDKIIISNSLIKLNNVSTQAQKFLLKLRQEGCALATLAQGIIPWIFSSHFLSNDQKVQDLIQLMESNPYPQTLIGVKRQLQALLGFNSSSWFNQLKGPALVIGGDEDILCPRDSELLANHIEDAKFVEFHRVGHVPMIEIPKEYVGILTNYLK
jgi:3-oxoadipate enol-lactonase